MVFVKIFQNLSPIISKDIERYELFNSKQFSKCAVLSSHVREDLRPSHKPLWYYFPYLCGLLGKNSVTERERGKQRP